MLIVGLLGRSRAGKDTVARALVAALATYGERAEVRRLSQPLKDAARALYGFGEDQVAGDAKERRDARHGLTPREAIQRLCAHVMMTHDIAFFTRRLYEDLEAAGAGGAPGDAAPTAIVVPDVRYAHDVAEIRRRGGLVVKVTRDVAAAGHALHACEDPIDLLEADVTLENRGSVADLEAAARAEVLPRALALRPAPPPPSAGAPSGGAA